MRLILGLPPYRVATTIFLLCQDDGTRSLSCIESRFAFDDSFLLGECASTASDIFADAGDVIPVGRHLDGDDGSSDVSKVAEGWNEQKSSASSSCDVD